MRRIVVFTLVLLTVSVSAYAMTVSQGWDKTYGGSSFDELSFIQQTMDGGYVAAGYTASFGVGLLDIWILKLNATGDIAWQKSYGTSYGEVATSIQQTRDGGYIVSGTQGTQFWYKYNILILKLDSVGNIIWQKTYGAWGDESNASIKETSDGGYILAGTTESFGAGGKDIAVIRLDSNGGILWQKTYGGSGDDGVPVSNFRTTVEQTSDGNYIVATFTESFGNGQGDALVLKLDNNGGILWQKTYGGGDLDAALSITETTDEGYILAGATYSYGAGEDDFWVLKLDSSGSVVWQKTYGGDGWEFATSIIQTADGQYVVAGGSSSDGKSYLWVMKLYPDNGNILWKKTYTERLSGFYPSIQQTLDGGYIVGSNYQITDTSFSDLWVLKLNSNGEIAECEIMDTPEIIVSDTSVSAQECNVSVSEANFTIVDQNIEPQDTSASISTLCYYEDPNDMDGDGIENTPGGTMASSMFLADEDNCPDMPNGPFLGTCTAGNTYKIGRPCISDVECGIDGFCSMNQEDSNGNGMGDACYLCEADFDCNGSVDSNDVSDFLADTGRNTYNNPCTNEEPCNGDFYCDGTVASDDVSKFIEDTGRNQYFNPCPACIQGPWCVYP